MRGQFPAPQILEWDLAEISLFGIWMDKWSFPSVQRSTGNVQGSNSLPSIFLSWVQRIWASPPWIPAHEQKAWRKKNLSTSSMPEGIKERQKIIVQSTERRESPFPALAWIAGLKVIKGNLEMRIHQMIINKQSFLCWFTCHIWRNLGQEGLFYRNMECCSSQEPSVQLGGIWSALCVKDGLSTLLLHRTLHLPHKTQPGGLSPSFLQGNRWS